MEKVAIVCMHEYQLCVQSPVACLYIISHGATITHIAINW